MATYNASVTTILTPTQSTKRLLPEVESKLEPNQEIRSSIKMASVSSQLIPVQTLRSNIKNRVIENKLEPSQIISTSSSVLSNASQQEEQIQLGLGISDGGTFKKQVATNLTPSHSGVGYGARLGGYRKDQT